MEELLNSHFMGKEQRHHRMLSAQEAGMRTAVARGWGGWLPVASPRLNPDPIVFVYKVSVLWGFKLRWLTG